MKRAWLLLLWCGCALALASGCGRRREASSSAASSGISGGAPAGDLFANGAVWQIEIEIPRSGLNVLRRTAWGEGGDRPTAKATVKEGGVVYTNVALHLKGAAGSFRPVDDRPAMTLNFDRIVAGQSFHGLHKISLNNSVQDPSFLSEKISRELFDQAGVHPALAAWSSSAARNQEHQAEWLKQRIARRGDELGRQLGATPAPPLRFGNDGATNAGGTRVSKRQRLY